MSDAEHVYSIADNHAQTVQVCIDRLRELGANDQLKLLTGKLQKLADRATPDDEDKGTRPLGANGDGLKFNRPEHH